jgi:carbon monoxide dehydrogenase subunit G
LDGISAQITIGEEIERVWDFLTDYDALASHLRGLSRSRLLRSENGYKVVEQVGRPGLPLLPAELAIRLKVVERPPSRIFFEQIEGFFKNFQGSWELAPAAAGSTLVRYHLSARLRGFLPERVLRPVLRQGAGEALHQLKTAIEKAAGRREP